MIELQQVAIRAGTFQLSNVTFRIETGEYAVLMGRTGRGKTTILEAICGLRTVHSGQILLDGRDVTQLPPNLREIGYVPQDLALFPTMTVREQLEFALRRKKASLKLIEATVQEFAELLGINHLLPRKPAGLSGGESQRVALGRALSFRPSVLLLDEPLSALDDATRQEMYALLKRVQLQTGVTTIHVTHSISEAERLADRRFELVDGQIVEAAAANGNSTEQTAESGS